MGTQVRYGTIAVGAYMAHQPGTHQAAFRDQYLPGWDRGGARGPRTRDDKMRWASLWSYGCRVGFGTPSGTDGAGVIGIDMTIADPYTPMVIGDGCQSLKWLRGRCEDVSGNGSSGANVQAFRTSDDAFAGEVVSLDDGTYMVPTPYTGAHHYIVAYKPGAPDIGGTSVNTLTPTNIDGT